LRAARSLCVNTEQFQVCAQHSVVHAESAKARPAPYTAFASRRPWMWQSGVDMAALVARRRVAVLAALACMEAHSLADGTRLQAARWRSAKTGHFQVCAKHSVAHAESAHARLASYTAFASRRPWMWQSRACMATLAARRRSSCALCFGLYESCWNNGDACQ
jgi:hypothetical protein